MMATSPLTIAHRLLRNFLTSLFFYADKSLIYFLNKYQLLEFLRYSLLSTFLFFLGLLPSFLPDLSYSSLKCRNYPSETAREDNCFASIDDGSNTTATRGSVRDSGVARALSQLLLIMNDIPVGSRKYDLVRSLADKFIDENLIEGNEELREVNCAVLSTAFTMSLSQLEDAVAEQGHIIGNDVPVPATKKDYYFYNRARCLVRGVTRYGRSLWRYTKSRDDLNCGSGSSAEKLAAELLWLAQKMVPSGCAHEAVCKWASASHLAWLALSAEPRLQGLLVKVSAFLFKQANEMNAEEEGRRTTIPSAKYYIRMTKMKLLMSWLPLLCRANNGIDAPILNLAEKAELERILEEIISSLEEEEEQERVLSIWLHNFTYCADSDWPNLRSFYTNWFTASRRRLVIFTAVTVN